MNMFIDRKSLGMTFFTKYPKITRWRLADVILCIILIGGNVAVYFFKPFERQFTINDVTISHPYAHHQRVNDTQLLVYSLIIPLSAIIFFSVLEVPRHRLYVLYVSVLGLFLSFSCNMLITSYLKNWISRCRPDFLERCVPREGLSRDVLYTAREACTTDNWDLLYEGYRSTPSGHSSESFAGLGYLYLWLSGQLLTENPSVGSWRKVLAFTPVMGAAVIACSRTQDYRHHFSDVVLGGIIGSFVAWWAYRRNFPSIYSHNSFKPHLSENSVSYDDNSLLPKLNDEEAISLSI